MKKSTVVSSGFALASVTLLLAGCGLAEVGASAATQGASAAEQAKQARETEAKFQQKLDQANQAAAEQRANAEAQSQ
jgi:cell division protein FtsX